jgi:hypothetical protein
MFLIQKSLFQPSKPANRPKSVEDFINEIRDDPRHKLEVSQNQIVKYLYHNI